MHVTVALEAVDNADLLVNLADRLPDGLPRFARVAEIIDADECAGGSGASASRPIASTSSRSRPISAATARTSDRRRRRLRL